jgi:hypothetical protein
LVILKVILFLRCLRKRISGYSAARLAHLVWDQRAAGSNPATPTKEKPWDRKVPGFIFFRMSTRKPCTLVPGFLFLKRQKLASVSGRKRKTERLRSNRRALLFVQKLASVRDGRRKHERLRSNRRAFLLGHLSTRITTQE